MNLSNQTISKLTLAEFLQLTETKPEQEYLAGKISQKPMPQGEHRVLQASLALSAGSPAPYPDRDRSRDESRRD